MPGRPDLDNLNTHISAAMGRFVRSHPDSLTEVRLPACAPDLNAAERASGEHEERPR
jgi:transposase